MNLQQFIEKYDREGVVVLLEGKRTVAEEDKPKLETLGRLLATCMKRACFRSGNADGADLYFSKGVAAVDATRLQVITPYTGHRKKANLSYETISLDDITLAAESEIVYQSKGNKKTEKLIDQYVSGDKNQFSIKAAYIIRDTIKAIGTENIKPATVGIFYDDLANPLSGGTGHTMNVCEQNGIEVLDQRVWFGWLDEGI